MAKGRVLCCSDIHGNYELFQQIKDFLKPEDTLYVLGDCADRGKDGWQIIKEVYTSPQMIYLQGNHEKMLANAMCGFDKQLYAQNGGNHTYRTWKYKDGAPKGWVYKLTTLPLEAEYINKRGQRIVMTHAGYTPSIGFYPTEDELLWDRFHIKDKWDENYPDTYIVHGHTLIPYMPDIMENKDIEIKPGAFYYCDGHKINIDCGTIITGAIVLLDLDTFEEHMFYTKDSIWKEDND